MSNARALTIRASAVALAVLLNHTGSLAAETFSDAVRPFFAKYCFECHDNGTAEGGLDLAAVATDLSNPEVTSTWIRIYDRVRIGEMPPQDATQPTEQHRATFTRLLGEPLTKAHAATKGTVLRRLNRREYQNSMNDMFGTHLDLIGMLP